MKVNKKLRGFDITKLENNIRFVSCFFLPVMANIAYLSFTLFCDNIEVSPMFYAVSLIYALSMALYIYINTMCVYQMMMLINPFLYPLLSLFIPDGWMSVITGIILILGIGKFAIGKLSNDS